MSKQSDRISQLSDSPGRSRGPFSSTEHPSDEALQSAANGCGEKGQHRKSQKRSRTGESGSQQEGTREGVRYSEQTNEQDREQHEDVEQAFEDESSDHVSRGRTQCPAKPEYAYDVPRAKWYCVIEGEARQERANAGGERERRLHGAKHQPPTGDPQAHVGCERQQRHDQ
jgi:hypothetical protein